MTATGTDAARQPLSRDAIVAAAISVADADGVGALTMRNLARHLGYEVMSLYNHVANKGELLALMVDAVAVDIAGPESGVAPMAAVRAMAISARNAFVRHPWAPSSGSATSRGRPEPGTWRTSCAPSTRAASPRTWPTTASMRSATT